MRTRGNVHRDVFAEPSFFCSSTAAHVAVVLPIPGTHPGCQPADHTARNHDDVERRRIQTTTAHGPVVRTIFFSGTLSTGGTRSTTVIRKHQTRSFSPSSVRASRHQYVVRNGRHRARCRTLHATRDGTRSPASKAPTALPSDRARVRNPTRRPSGPPEPPSRERLEQIVERLRELVEADRAVAAVAVAVASAADRSCSGIAEVAGQQQRFRRGSAVAGSRRSAMALAAADTRRR